MGGALGTRLIVVDDVPGRGRGKHDPRVGRPGELERRGVSRAYFGPGDPGPPAGRRGPTGSSPRLAQFILRAREPDAGGDAGTWDRAVALEGDTATRTGL